MLEHWPLAQFHAGSDAIIEAVAKRTCHAPDELLLIDDSARNVESAKACGWRAGLWDGTRSVAEVVAEAEAG